MALTELESAVLGVIWRRAPCSAYAVQQNFALVSAGWAASPGAIYPLLAKLHRLGLLSVVDEAWGRRSKRLYSLTAAGRGVLCEWVIEMPHWAGRPVADPLRTRSFFLDALDSDENRGVFISRAEALTRAALARLEAGLATLPPAEPSLERLGQMGGILQLRARLEWLGEARRFFGLP